jgi:hypothetical protein
MTDRRKDKLQRIEEPLEVGLDRYKRSRTQLPTWFVEHTALIVLGAFFVLVVLPFVIFGSRFGSTPQPIRDATRLVIRGAPNKVFAEGSSTELQSVKVVVGNVGAHSAREVKVVISMGEKAFVLTGAAQIESGRSESFAGNVAGAVKAGTDLQVSVTCANCMQE